MNPKYTHILGTLAVTMLLSFNTGAQLQIGDSLRPRLPLPWPEVPLNQWRFDDTAWQTLAQTQPLLINGPSFVPGWSGYTLRMAGTGPSLLALPEVSVDAKTNLPANGPATLRFWFAPDWASQSVGGDGPGEEVRLLETGAWSSQTAATRCALVVEADGNALRLDLAGTNYQGGAILYRRLQWSNSIARLVDTNWLTAAQASNVNYRGYYDIEGTNQLMTPTNVTVSAPQAGGGTRINLTGVSSRLMNAVIRDGFLYTCQHIGLIGTNGTYSGNEFGTNVDRSGVQWLKLRVEAETLSYYKHGRIYDAGMTNINYYYFPSIAVNCASDIAFGFSGSSATNHIGAYYAWRPSAGPMTEAPVLFRPGLDYFDNVRWGDYSATAVDPSDSTTFWTIQEYAKERMGSSPIWGTSIGKITRR